MLSLKEGDRDPEPDQKLQDLVNKTMWKKCCFSGDGEYVCAGSARQVSPKRKSSGMCIVMTGDVMT